MWRVNHFRRLEWFREPPRNRNERYNEISRLVSIAEEDKDLDTYNRGHNILEFYNILVQSQFATSETKIDIGYNKIGLRVAEELKRDLRKNRKY